MPVNILEWWRQWNAKRASERNIDSEYPTPVVVVGAQGSGGELVFGDSATAGPKLAVLEDNSSTIDSNVSATFLLHRYGTPNGMFFGIAPSAPNVNYQRRPFQTTLTATAGGEIVAADVGPPTVAGYQAAMCLTHVFSDQTDAGIAFTIAPSAGAFTTGLAAMTIATTANTVTPDYGNGLFWYCGTDAATIQFACAAGQAGANQNVTFIGYYWYET